MGLIDAILNLACLLLWLNWRSVQIATPDKAPPVSLAATLKKAEPHRASRWVSLVVLFLLLLGRAVFYWNVGAGLSWTPSLRLGVVSLPFRSDDFGRILLYSLLSFGLVLGVVYSWLLLISAINHGVASEDPVQRLVRLQLGWLERWPAGLKLAAPVLAVAGLWGLGNPGFARLGILPASPSPAHLWQQAFLLGLMSLLSWRFLLIGLCLLYMLNSYVYFGKSWFWNFIHTTGANFLRPLQRAPMCVGKFDFSPAVAIVLIVLVAYWAGLWLPRAFQTAHL